MSLVALRVLLSFKAVMRLDPQPTRLLGVILQISYSSFKPLTRPIHFRIQSDLALGSAYALEP